MKKFIVYLASAVIASLLGLGGWLVFKGDGPRERVKADNGEKVIVEELSYYVGGGKVFGKVFKPTDENGLFSDSMGERPAVVFFHEPLATSFPQATLTSLSCKGLVGHMCSPRKARQAEACLEKILGEKFVEKDLVFVVADGPSAEIAAEAAARQKKAVAGLVLIGASDEVLQGKNLRKYGKEPLVIADADKSKAVARILEYLEINGALK